jgi:hypothetical protein
MDGLQAKAAADGKQDDAKAAVGSSKEDAVDSKLVDSKLADSKTAGGGGEGGGGEGKQAEAGEEEEEEHKPMDPALLLQQLPKFHGKPNVVVDLENVAPGEDVGFYDPARLPQVRWDGTAWAYDLKFDDARRHLSKRTRTATHAHTQQARSRTHSHYQWRAPALPPTHPPIARSLTGTQHPAGEPRRAGGGDAGGDELEPVAGDKLVRFFSSLFLPPKPRHTISNHKQQSCRAKRRTDGQLCRLTTSSRVVWVWCICST